MSQPLYYYVTPDTLMVLLTIKKQGHLTILPFKIQYKYTFLPNYNIKIGCISGILYFQGTLKDTLAECRPTAFFGVPRVWEKLMEAMVAKGRDNSNMKKKISAWARDIGLRGTKAMMKGQEELVYSYTMNNYKRMYFYRVLYYQKS